MTDRVWKQAERRIAHLLGGERTGPTGTPKPDIVADWLVVEVKHRKRLPKWLKGALAQAQAHARDRLPICVLHECGGRYLDCLVVIGLGDFLDWFGGGQDDSV